MKDTTPNPINAASYDAAFRAEALRLAEQSHSAQAAARTPNIDSKRIYQWQKVAQTPIAAALGTALDPATAAELRLSGCIQQACGGMARHGHPCPRNWSPRPCSGAF